MTDGIPFGPTGKIVYERTYSRVQADGSREQWPDTVRRVVDGNLALVDERHQLLGEREDLIRLMQDFKIVPAGRHLWASGVKNAQHLFNPVIGSSEVTTRDGVRKIDELVGQTIDVLSMSDGCDMATRKWDSVGTWRPATFIYSGEQETYRVAFESGREVVSTAEHNWFSVRSRKKLTTLELVGESIPVMAVPRPEENLDYMQGLLRGAIFGDGTVDKTGAKIHIHADQDEEIINLFRRAGHKHSYSASRGFWYVGRLPMEWKLELPSLQESPSFWRGFFAGWLAADGHVNKKGSVMIHNRDRSVFDRCHAGLLKAGIHMISEPVLCRQVNPFNGEKSTLYRQSFKRYSLTERDFVQQKKRDRFLETEIKLRTTTDKVVSVEKTGRTEPVYCCLEPATHSWTVNGVLTGNCWVAGWTEKPSDHFAFTFMRLMEGGGVGASYSNSNLSDYPPVQQELYVHIVCDEEHQDYQAMKDAGVLSEDYDADWAGAFIVEDSREGWAAALVDLIDTHYRDEVTHFQRVYDVSRVRPAGAKLKTFGGRASGPQPLARMLIDVCEILSGVSYHWGQAESNGKLTGIDAMEIDHAIAQCVVAGGVRRSARMAMMHWADPQIAEFLDIKQTSGSHWTTNISVEVDEDFWQQVSFADRMGASDFTSASLVLKAISTGMVLNGEPGFWDSSLSNVGEPNPVVATNPCFHPDTIVETVEGPMPIKDILVPTQVYTKGPSGKLEIRKASASFVTKRNAETLRIGLTNGTELIVTPDHKIMRRDGSYARADELVQHDALEVICRARRGWRYSGVKLSSEPNRAYRMEHRMIYEGIHGDLPPGIDVDHINRDHHDNRIQNLRAIPHSDHSRLSRSQVPNNHQVVVGNRFVSSGNGGKKLLEDAIRPPRATNWGRTPRVAYVEPGPVSDVYDITVDETHNLIANGVVAHNCGEITLQEWEPCNLGHVNLAGFVREDTNKVDWLGLFKAHTLMTRFLIRATFSEVGDPKSAEVLARNRRIGVGHFGVASFLALTKRKYSEAPVKGSFRSDLRELAKEVDRAATEFCHELRIPVPVKKRTVAPTGTIAKLSGHSEGIHAIFAKYFDRRVRFSTTDPDQLNQLAELEEQGYHVENDLFAANTMVVTIPTKDTLVQEVVDRYGRDAEDLVEAQSDLTLHQMLAFQAMYQDCWADNAVSFTANVDPDRYTAADVAQTISEFGGRLKGATLFPEKSFPQAPYTRITKAEYDAAISKSVADGVDESCGTGGCPIR